MVNIDNKHNITLNTGDNATIEFKLCGEELKKGDAVMFKTQEQTVNVTEFTDGIARIKLQSKEETSNSCYYIKVTMSDGREETVINGTYKRLGACCNG